MVIMMVNDEDLTADLELSPMQVLEENSEAEMLWTRAVSLGHLRSDLHAVNHLLADSICIELEKPLAPETLARIERGAKEFLGAQTVTFTAPACSGHSKPRGGR